MAAYLLLQETLKEERSRRRRLLRDNLNIINIPDNEFISSRTRRSGIDPKLKILAALNFYARGSYQGAVSLSSDAPMAQQTVSRCLQDVTNALNSPSIVEKYIRFPQNNSERNAIKRQFYEKYGLPGVVGCIDCTHVAIIRPNNNEERFFNRKHFHSLNVQVICDAECSILNVDASYGGATHDSFIWTNHEIKSHLENLQDETYLLGKIVIACCVLHNLCNRAGLQAPTLTEEEQAEEDSRQGNSAVPHQALQQGRRARDRLVQLLERNRS